jgi:hypothetical protein
VVFGLLAMRTGGLWAPFAAHWAWNWGEQSVAGATPNPGIDSLGALFDLDLSGPALLSGGADALNGAISTTVVLGILALGLGLVGALRRERSRSEAAGGAERVDPVAFLGESLQGVAAEGHTLGDRNRH